MPRERDRCRSCNQHFECTLQKPNGDRYLTCTPCREKRAKKAKLAIESQTQLQSASAFPTQPLPSQRLFTPGLRSDDSAQALAATQQGQLAVQPQHISPYSWPHPVAAIVSQPQPQPQLPLFAASQVQMQPAPMFQTHASMPADSAQPLAAIQQGQLDAQLQHIASYAWCRDIDPAAANPAPASSADVLMLQLTLLEHEERIKKLEVNPQRARAQHTRTANTHACARMHAVHACAGCEGERSSRPCVLAT